MRYQGILLFLLFLILCVGGFSYLWIAGSQRVVEGDSWIEHSRVTIKETSHLSTLTYNMLAAQRGYLLSNDENFLDEYRHTKASFIETATHIGNLVSDSPVQQSRAQELRRRANEFVNTLDARNQTFAKNHVASLDDQTRVKFLSREIISLTGQILQDEYSLLNARVERVERQKNLNFEAVKIGGMISALILVILNIFLLREYASRAQAEVSLREAEGKFRHAIESANDGIFEWNIVKGDMICSPQYWRMLGYEPGDFKQELEAVINLLHPEDKEEALAYVHRHLSGETEDYTNVFRMLHKDGHYIWISSRGRVYYDEHGKPVRMAGMHTDVTKIKSFEDELIKSKEMAEKANRAKSDFLAHMSHEIRTPLTSISGIAEIFERHQRNLDDKQKELIKALNASTSTLKDLVNDILDFSKIDSGTLQLEDKPIRLASLFDQIISIMKIKTMEKGLDFMFDYGAVESLTCNGDILRLRQIIINLIGNAVKFTDRGSVRVFATRAARAGVEYLQIAVADTGIGIDPNNQMAIFGEFMQADTSVSRKYGGTGLGLSISLKLAQLMGGDIQLDSTPGAGSTFTLSVPLRNAVETDQDVATEGAKQSSAPLGGLTVGSRRVLLVEDYEGNIVVLTYILDSLGLEYDVARTGLEALELWGEKTYDLILMDVQMPEMDGFTATSEIRKVEAEDHLPRTPIIGMTAHALVGDSDKCIAAGMDDYLPKPIVVGDLKAKMFDHLNKPSHAA